MSMETVMNVMAQQDMIQVLTTSFWWHSWTWEAYHGSSCVCLAEKRRQ